MEGDKKREARESRERKGVRGKTPEISQREEVWEVCRSEG